MEHTIKKTLQNELEAKKNNWQQQASKEQLRIGKENIEKIINNNIVENAKKEGDSAPNFKLRNALGKEIELQNYLKKGLVILTWYRGGWCPYCNLTLQYLQQYLSKFNKEGANLIALTPELPDKSLSTKEKHQLQFEVLSDVGNKVAKNYGLVYQLTDELAEAYKKGINLSSFNGDESSELPLAATYIIDKKGIIKYAFLNADYTQRAEPSVLLEILKTL